jgi:hypothetical protein
VVALGGRQGPRDVGQYPNAAVGLGEQAENCLDREGVHEERLARRSGDEVEVLVSIFGIAGRYGCTVGVMALHVAHSLVRGMECTVPVSEAVAHLREEKSRPGEE